MLSNGAYILYVPCAGNWTCGSGFACNSRNCSGKHNVYVHLLEIPENCSQIGRTKCASHFACKSNELLSNWAYKLYITFVGNSKELLSNGTYTCAFLIIRMNDESALCMHIFVVCSVDGRSFSLFCCSKGAPSALHLSKIQSPMMSARCQTTI